MEKMRGLEEQKTEMKKVYRELKDEKRHLQEMREIFYEHVILLRPFIIENHQTQLQPMFERLVTVISQVIQSITTTTETGQPLDKPLALNSMRVLATLKLEMQDLLKDTGPEITEYVHKEFSILVPAVKKAFSGQHEDLLVSLEKMLKEFPDKLMELLHECDFKFILSGIGCEDNLERLPTDIKKNGTQYEIKQKQSLYKFVSL